MDSTFILPVAVIRKFGEKGAEFSRLMILAENTPDGDIMFRSEIVKTRFSDWDWEDILEAGCAYGTPGYYTPNRTFYEADATYEGRAEFTSIIYPLVFSGGEAKILAGVFGVADAEINKKPGENFPLLTPFLGLCRTIEENGSISEAISGALTAVANKIIALNIPALVPYGQSELQASGLL
jgi:hypothetical protein